MKWLRVLLFFAPLMACANFAQAKTRISVQGIDGVLKENVDAYLASIPEESYSTSTRFQSQLELNIRDALKALGYYQPIINIELAQDIEQENQAIENVVADNTSSNNISADGASTDNDAKENEVVENNQQAADTDKDTDNEILVTIEAGDPVMIYSSEIELVGDAAEDEDFIRLVDESKLNLGQAMNHGNYEAFKSNIANLALQKGYFDGHFTTNQFQVSPERGQALVKLNYDSGTRYVFGKTNIHGSQIDENRVRSLVPYKEGEPYLSRSVGELNQNLSTTEWFSSIGVRPDLDNASETKVLPMNIRVRPQEENLIETGLGYSTDVGVRGKLSWKKPWLNSLGHSASVSTVLSKPEQTVIANYKMPLEDVLHEYYLVQYGLKNEDDRDTKSHEQNFSIERHWQYDTGWNRTIQTRVLYEDYEQASLSGSSLFVLPGISFSRIRTRGDSSMPSWGDKQSITFEYGDPAMLSDTRIFRVVGHTAWIRGNDNHRFLTRLDAGASIAEDWDEVPPSLRFFVGGNSTLRGYGFESISPEDKNGELLGGAYTATSTLEYQYRVAGNWWGATFVDFGDSWTDKPDWKTGVGVGARWASPVGPVRLDFAYGVDSEDYEIHFTLGPEL